MLHSTVYMFTFTLQSKTTDIFERAYDELIYTQPLTYRHLILYTSKPHGYEQ